MLDAAITLKTLILFYLLKWQKQSHANALMHEFVDAKLTLRPNNSYYSYTTRVLALF